VTSGLARSFTVMVPGRLAVMNRPGMYGTLRDDLVFLEEQGVGAIVSLTGSPLDAAELRTSEMEYLHEPVTDFTPPTPEQIERIIEFIRGQHETRGCMVLVHCGAGLGRSGTVAACYLVHTGMEPRPAIERVRELRPFSVETAEQEGAVEAYARRAGRGDSGS
jgi:atypical dual specificity phosphatase